MRKYQLKDTRSKVISVKHGLTLNTLVKTVEMSDEELEKVVDMPVGDEEYLDQGLTVERIA